ncbi:hypothetical protein WICPIJ_001360 [Wickerhamomyces pijperi]|uniref:GDT1 family protein n=1 Tax=Wickerhamomyces pijperi TaxID=599730 RepID=A0A9P8QBR8_WICPI|nr:hypothetical protein WICPIJ_001360 [Wickerhamomyces pijperi]
MKYLSKSTLTALAVLSTLAISSESSTNDGLLTEALSALGPLKPHSINLTPRDKISVVDDITDSNTAPIEDSTGSTKKKAAKNVVYPSASFGSLGSAELNSEDNVPPESYVKSHSKGSASSSSSTELSIASTKGATSVKSTEDGDKSNSGSDKNSNPFLMAISMIIVSEIGDKTFLISALMAMRNNRMVVFTASFASLAIMTILSGIVGHTLPSLLSPRVTQFLAAGLFVVFGIKLTQEGLAMPKDLGVEEELAEVEEEIDLEFNDVENGRLQSNGIPQSDGSFLSNLRSQPQVHAFLQSLQNIASITFSPLWIQVFIMIFLGEWGDRSQIATIAMAAGSNYWPVICGATIGHGLCTAAAVIGGKMLASKISMRNVTLGGALAFFVFSVLYLLEAINGSSEE